MATKKRGKRKTYPVGFLLILAGAAFIAVIFLISKQEADIRAHWLPGTAVIVDTRVDKTFDSADNEWDYTYYADIAYTTADGTEQETQVDAGRDYTDQIGETVCIIYDPDSSYHARIGEFRSEESMDQGAAIGYVIGGILIVGGILVLVQMLVKQRKVGK